MLADVPRESATTLADVAPGADAVLDATDQHAVRDFALQHDALVSDESPRRSRRERRFARHNFVGSFQAERLKAKESAGFGVISPATKLSRSGNKPPSLALKFEAARLRRGAPS